MEWKRKLNLFNWNLILVSWFLLQVSGDVGAIIQMIGPHPKKFSGKSGRCDELINAINRKVPAWESEIRIKIYVWSSSIIHPSSVLLNPWFCPKTKPTFVYKIIILWNNKRFLEAIDDRNRGKFQIFIWIQFFGFFFFGISNTLSWPLTSFVFLSFSFYFLVFLIKIKLETSVLSPWLDNWELFERSQCFFCFSFC